jgi:hypothetical protein
MFKRLSDALGREELSDRNLLRKNPDRILFLEYFSDWLSLKLSSELTITAVEISFLRKTVIAMPEWRNFT